MVLPDPPIDSLGSVGELATLARILPRLPAASATLLGPGDDAAVVVAPDGRFVVTCDMMIEGPDFRLAWSSPHDLGWKAAATNLADVAAMGAVATALVVAIAAPSSSPVALLEGIADGLRDGCAAMAPGCGVVGGDLSVAPVLTISVTAFGDLEGRPPITRSGARPGDVLAVSGPLGLAAEGLELLFARAVDGEGEPDAAAAARVRAAHPRAVLAQLAPTPPIADGPAAARAGATAMMDLSDGLALDAARLAASSSVRLDIRSGVLGDHLSRALGGGEDHSLLAAFPIGAHLPGGFVVIGRVETGAGITVDGHPLERVTGWDPYRSGEG